MAVPYLSCMLVVASTYHLPPRVLPSLQAVEGGHNYMVRQDANGSVDYGVMQVNTIWIAKLAQYTKLPAAAIRARLIGAPCFNIAAAGVILRVYLNEADGNLMEAIGDYHSHTLELNQNYQREVLAAAAQIFSPGH